MAPDVHYETNLFINNEFVPSKSGKTFEVISPLTSSTFCCVAEAQKEDVDAAVVASQAAQDGWTSLAAHERAAPMFRLAQLIIRDASVLADLESMAMGKPVSLILKMDVPACAGIFGYFAGSAMHILGETSTAAPNFINMTIRQPYGVVGLIIPWNVSLIMFAMKVAPAVVCGNTVVLKTSEKAPLAALHLAALIKEAHFPPGVINIVSGPGAPTGQSIASHMAIRKVAFTGSTATGRSIMKMAADSNLKNVSLELGGKSPAIIFEDADLSSAVRYTHCSINHNSGQHCQANSRILVQRSVAEEYVRQLKDLMSQVKIGDPADSTTLQGPQVDQRQLAHIEELVEAGKTDGRLVHGGERYGAKGAFMQPTILCDVPITSRAYQEEVFGPVIIVNTFDTELEALKEANSTDYGLFASVFTKDFERAIRVSKELQSGAVGVNCAVPLRALDMPVGGWKQSGIGRELSLHGLETYTELKTIFLRYAHDSTALANNWLC